MDFKALFPGAPADGIDLLNGMLQFNPYFRISVEKALAHPYFADIRRPKLEKVYTQDKMHKLLELDKKEQLTIEQLKKLFNEALKAINSCL